MTAVVPVFNPRAEPRRAVKRGYPRGAGSVRLCRNLAAVERLLYQRLVDAVVLDVKTAPAAALALPARFPRIPMFVLSALRSDDGLLLAACGAAGFAGVLVEGVDNAWPGSGSRPVRRRWLGAKRSPMRPSCSASPTGYSWPPGTRYSAGLASPRRRAMWRRRCG